MDPIETAIRNALEKGNADDRAFRARVYRSAFSALHRVLEEGNGITPEEAARRRDLLKMHIAEIEAEYAPKGEAVLDAADTVKAETDVPGVDQETRLGSEASSSAPEIRAEPRRDAPIMTSPEDEILADTERDSAFPRLDTPRQGRRSAPQSRTRRKPSRRPVTGIALALILLAVVAGIGWWFMQSGDLEGQRSDSAGWHPPQTLEQSGEAEAPKKEGEADAEQKWITIFSPDNPATASAGAGSQADVRSEGDTKYMRIISGPKNAEVAFDVGKGVLEQIAGKHALFDVVARAEEGKDTQMSVSCDFGALGTCDRKRYQVSNQRNDFLFEMDMPDKTPGAAGTISIGSDITGQGKPVDIYEIRVSTRQK